MLRLFGARGFEIREHTGSYMADAVGIAPYLPGGRTEGVSVYPPGYYDGV